MPDRRPTRNRAGVNSQLEGDYYVDPEMNDVEIDDSEGGKLSWSYELSWSYVVFFLKQINRIRATTYCTTRHSGWNVKEKDSSDLTSLVFLYSSDLDLTRVPVLYSSDLDLTRFPVLYSSDLDLTRVPVRLHFRSSSDLTLLPFFFGFDFTSVLLQI